MVFINIKKCDVIILAGGHSERMNIPKPFIEFSQGISFLEKIINEYYKFGCEKIILILNYKYDSPSYLKYLKEKYNIHCKLNHHPEYGRFYSLKLGAELIHEDDHCFIQNIDNPFIDDAMLNKIYKKRNIDSYIVPVHNGKGGHPVLIGSKISQRIINENSNDINLKELLREYNRIEVQSEDIRVTANINTVSDYYTYFGKEPCSIFNAHEKHLS